MDGEVSGGRVEGKGGAHGASEHFSRALSLVTALYGFTRQTLDHRYAHAMGNGRTLRPDFRNRFGPPQVSALRPLVRGS